ncbi:unnamed protein product [Meloidogyne enterolobii]|uniref:Uncharacterized protein n=1 Tax=Meloidogyne enterolobii TaxID=390850 RepID=A0ACB0ZHW8_MELEN
MARRRSKKNSKKLIKKIIQSKKLKTNRKASEMSSQEEETKSTKRRTRMNFSEEQICYLEDFFGNTCHYPDSYQKEGGRILKTNTVFFLIMRPDGLFFNHPLVCRFIRRGRSNRESRTI